MTYTKIYQSKMPVVHPRTKAMDEVVVHHVGGKELVLKSDMIFYEICGFTLRIYRRYLAAGLGRWAANGQPASKTAAVYVDLAEVRRIDSRREDVITIKPKTRRKECTPCKTL